MSQDCFKTRQYANALHTIENIVYGRDTVPRLPNTEHNYYSVCVLWELAKNSQISSVKYPWTIKYIYLYTTNAEKNISDSIAY